MNFKVYGGASVFAFAIIIIYSLVSCLFYNKVNWIQVILSGIVAFCLFTISLYIVQKLNK
ncbi:hypothetical protein CAI16_17600 [Virgibacillus dokdonensis]|uniref:Uncharacterized protein n=1 Tax=Virgibacillus dokdonensis TaxID=302167 RepID=A0A3E0WJY6_9BACI|nr:hypothetical protein [Virgibacillus dokdonensis]RFA32513.1 hypothetical protein CAI16_17600 [Virgibacillus dokdonensis]